MNFKTKIEKIDTEEIIRSEYVNWEYYKNSVIMITGATGLIGKQLVKTFLYLNENKEFNVKIIALIRNKKKAEDIFYPHENCLKYIIQDIEKPIKYRGYVDYIIHCANSTESKFFVEHPIETINSIIKGTENVLRFAKHKKIKSMVYLSSMEVYGDIPLNRKESLKEEDLGHIDILNPRSSYPQGKRITEGLCSYYSKEYNVPVKVARLAQTLGAGVDYNDNRVFAQFARNIVEKQDIVLKTEGKTIRSYIYITDAITAILSILERGENGESYNVANPDTTCSIREMAEMLCEDYPELKVKIELSNKYYPKDSNLFISVEKISSFIKWNPSIQLKQSFSNIISAFYYIKNTEHKKHNYFMEKIFSVRNTNLYKIITILGKEIKLDRQKLYKMMYAGQKIHKNRIVMNNFGGNGYGCNLKYIAEELIRQNMPYEIVWLCKDDTLMQDNKIPSKIKKMSINSKKGVKTLYSAKLIISNVHLNQFIKKGWIKRPEQIYIQTWHGSLGIKKIDYSVRNENSAFFTNEWKLYTDKDISYIDYLISNSDFENRVFKEGFKWNKDTLLVGHPRNDIFFLSNKEKENIRQKVYEYYNIPKNKKIIFYAPSFRDNKKLDVYNLDFDILQKSIENKFGNDWITLVRLHPQNFDLASFFNIPTSNIINATLYPDIQELLISADIGITDYSSWIFDFMLSKKPAFIYAEDIETYNTERGFYYSLERTPFLVAKNNEELINNIETFDYEKYKINVENFLKEKGCIEDGHASEKIVKLIDNAINISRCEIK